MLGPISIGLASVVAPVRRVSQEIAGAEGPAPVETDGVGAAPNEAALLKATLPELMVVGPV